MHVDPTMCDSQSPPWADNFAQLCRVASKSPLNATRAGVTLRERQLTSICSTKKVCKQCRGAKKDAQNDGSVTPMLTAAFFGHVPVVEVLLRW